MAKQISNHLVKKAKKIMEQGESIAYLKRDGQLPPIRLPAEVEKWYRAQAAKDRRKITDWLFLHLMNHYYEGTSQRDKISF